MPLIVSNWSGGGFTVPSSTTTAVSGANALMRLVDTRQKQNKTKQTKKKRNGRRPQAGISKQDALELQRLVTTRCAVVCRAGRGQVNAIKSKREVDADTLWEWKKGKASLCCREKVSESPR